MAPCGRKAGSQARLQRKPNQSNRANDRRPENGAKGSGERGWMRKGEWGLPAPRANHRESAAASVIPLSCLASLCPPLSCLLPVPPRWPVCLTFGQSLRHVSFVAPLRWAGRNESGGREDRFGSGRTKATRRKRGDRHGSSTTQPNTAKQTTINAKSAGAYSGCSCRLGHLHLVMLHTKNSKVNAAQFSASHAHGFST